MAMFPIFMIGLVAGAICMWSYMNLKRDIPSETRLKLLEDEIKSLKNDNNLLEKLNTKLYAKIDKLENNKK